MLRWIDNFEGYDTSGSIAATVTASSNVAKNYAYFGTATTGSAQTLQETYLNPMLSGARNCLSGTTNSPTPSASYALTTPLASTWAVGQTTFLGFSVFNAKDPISYVSNNTGQFGLANVSGTTYNGTLIKIGISSQSAISLAWMEGGLVNTQVINLAQPLSGDWDYFEVSMAPQASALGTFSLWVNNRVVYTGNITPFIYSGNQLSWVVYGTLGNNATGVAGNYVYGNGLSLPQSMIRSVGVSDFYICDDTTGLNTGRLGRIRVTSRAPAGDATPNEWTPYSGSTETSHAAIMANMPPNINAYLSTTSEVQTELYAGTAFPAMGSEQVVGMMVRVLASKDDPTGPDIAPLVKSGSTSTSITPTLLSSTPGYVNALLEKNPATNAAWIASDANNSNFGVISGTAP